MTGLPLFSLRRWTSQPNNNGRANHSHAPHPAHHTPAGPAKLVGRRYHLHLPGVAYATTTVVLVLGAINGQNNLLFFLFGLAVAGLIVSGILSGSALMGLQLERQVPLHGAVGEDLTIRYRITNRNRIFPAFGLTIEELPAWKTWRERPSTSWPDHLPRPLAFIAYTPPRGASTAAATVVPDARGVATFSAVRVWTSFPFGLTKKSLTFYQPAEVLVHPKPAAIKPGIPTQAAGTGDRGALLRRSRVGDEYYSLREYVPGDSMRAVAWRSTARLGYAVVREMAATPSRRLWIVLDLAGSDADSAEQAISVAAALAIRAPAAGFEPGLATADSVSLQPPRSGRRQQQLIMETLARLEVHAGAPVPDGRLIPGPSLERDFFVVVEAGRAPTTFTAPFAHRYSVHDDSILAEQPAPQATTNREPRPMDRFNRLWRIAIGGAA